MLLAEEPSNAVQITGLIVGLIGTCFTAIMAYLIARLNQKQSLQGHKLDAVQSELSDNTKATVKTLEKMNGGGGSPH